MTSIIEDKDFVKIDFVGRIKSTGQIFDLTKRDVAEKEGILKKEFKYEPLTVCVNSGQTIPGIDEALLGKKVGDKFQVEISPEKGFGNRNPKMIQITSESNFRKRGTRPVPGMQFDIDGKIATIKSVNGGRVILDFNHPLSGKNLVYDIEIKEKIEKPEDRLEEIKKLTGIYYDYEVDGKKAEIKIKMKEADSKLLQVIENNLQSFLPDLKVQVVSS